MLCIFGLGLNKKSIYDILMIVIVTKIDYLVTPLTHCNPFNVTVINKGLHMTSQICSGHYIMTNNFQLFKLPFQTFH